MRSPLKPRTGLLLTLSVLAVTAITVAGLVSRSQAQAARAPNIVFVLTDDLNLDEISVMPHLKTLLSDQGATFTNQFVSVSLCCPSRTSILRGQYSHNTGVQTNGGSNGGFETAYALGVEKSTVATWLQAAGYRTALFGKYLNGYPNTAPATYIPPGWDEWYSAAKGGNPYSEFNYTLNENGKLVKYGSSPADYGTDVYAGKATDFMTRSTKESKPFFTYISLYAPHQPATPAPRHAKLFQGVKAPRTANYNEANVSDKPAFLRNLPVMSAAVQNRVDALYRLRLQSLQAVDEAIQKIVDTLRATRQLENTFIVFSSDNGFHLGNHRMPSGKQTAFEEDIHLPLIVRGPGVKAGVKLEGMVGNIDFAPTFADWAGVKPPETVDGRSFAPLLSTNSPSANPPAEWRTTYLIEHWMESNAPRVRATGTEEPADQDQSKAAPLRGIPEFHALRTAAYTYVEYVTGERELYDLKNDAQQLTNIASQADPKLLESLAARLKALRTCAANTCRTFENAR